MKPTNAAPRRLFWTDMENTKQDGISSGLVPVAWLAPSNYEWPSHFISLTEIRNGEALVRLSDAEAIIAEKAAEIRALKQRPAHELREMLRSMQEGEMTVSRGIELVEMWLAGDYSDDQLPPVNNDLTEDQWPMEELRKARTEIKRLNRTPTIEEAETTVEHLRAYAANNGYSHGDYADVMSEAASQIEQQAERIKELEADLSEEVHIRDRMAHLLAETAVALKGPEKALHRHGWQDLPEVAGKQSAALKLASLALAEGVEYVEEPPEKNCTCHLAPPCDDCVEHSAVREFFSDARTALAAIDALEGE